MQSQQAAQVTGTPYDRLPPVERAHPVRHEHRPGSFEVAFGDAAPQASVQVRYGLDPVANVWVASFFDGATGEVVKTVPATRVMHQLAELRAQWERSVDRRA